MAALKLTSIYQCLQDKETMECVKHPLFLFIPAKQRNVVENKTLHNDQGLSIKFTWEFEVLAAETYCFCYCCYFAKQTPPRILRIVNVARKFYTRLKVNHLFSC